MSFPRAKIKRFNDIEPITSPPAQHGAEVIKKLSKSPSPFRSSPCVIKKNLNKTSSTKKLNFPKVQKINSINELKRKLNTAVYSLQSLEQQLYDEKNKKAELELALAKLANLVKNFELQTYEIDEEIEELAETVFLLEEANENLEKENGKLKEELRKLKDETEKKLTCNSEEIAELNNRLFKMIEELNEIKGKFKSLENNDKIETVVFKYLKLVDNYKVLLEVHREEQKKFINFEKTVNNEKILMETKLKNANEEFEKVNKEKRDLEVTEKSLNDKYHKLMNNYKVLHQVYEEEQKKFKDFEQEVNNEKILMETEFKNVYEQFEKVNEEKSVMEITEKSLRRALRDLTQRLISTDTDVKSLKIDIAMCDQTLEDYKQKCQQLRAELEASHSSQEEYVMQTKERKEHRLKELEKNLLNSFDSDLKLIEDNKKTMDVLFAGEFLMNARKQCKWEKEWMEYKTELKKKEDKLRQRVNELKTEEERIANNVKELTANAENICDKVEENLIDTEEDKKEKETSNNKVIGAMQISTDKEREATQLCTETEDEKYVNQELSTEIECVKSDSENQEKNKVIKLDNDKYLHEDNEVKNMQNENVEVKIEGLQIGEETYLGESKKPDNEELTAFSAQAENICDESSNDKIKQEDTETKKVEIEEEARKECINEKYVNQEWSTEIEYIKSFS